VERPAGALYVIVHRTFSGHVMPMDKNLLQLVYIYRRKHMAMRSRFKFGTVPVSTGDLQSDTSIWPDDLGVLVRRKLHFKHRRPSTDSFLEHFAFHPSVCDKN